MSKFVILTPGRSGSTYINKYLRACPNTFMFGEMFNSINKDEKVAALSDPEEYIRRKYARKD